MTPTPRPPAREVLASDYEDPYDRMLRGVLQQAWPLPALARLFVRHLGEPWQSGKLTGHGVRVGPRQLPHIDELSRIAADLLGVAAPELHVVPGPTPQAILLGAGERTTLVLTSSLLERTDENELLYLLGRQMGHIKSGHAPALTLLRWLKETVGTAAKSLALPAMLLAYRWQRAATLSADRAGLIASQDLAISCRALFRLALGSTARMGDLDACRYAREGMRELLRHPLRTAPELLEPSPGLALRIASLYELRASASYEELFPPARPASSA
jgi:Zn-dependent protease with chaperone function